MKKQPEEDVPEPRRRTGGRSARVQAAVLGATMDELKEHGYDGFSVAAVAARSGVHETSIYRRWKSRDGLILEATFALFAQDIPIPDRGSLREDLVNLLSGAVRQLSSPIGWAATQFAMALPRESEMTQEVRQQWAKRFASVREVFDRASLRGEWPAGKNPQDIIESLVGAVYLRVLHLREPVTAAHLKRLVDAVLPVAVDRRREPARTAP
ncbi:TetR/AcrR family transcriptional regulator [Variovorax sp. EL159]|uniref:TetR/AcrR family transcriptional regulator n=2 Tax=unclassified Variovorax TaxID=663243 RepID=UPI000884DC92|nr:TetR/AcrR family transcriptional regulator [Variovorax sp. EL159]SCX72990.1 transcriptional regulator, TetR family [Variovorax sp. EL159]